MPNKQPENEPIISYRKTAQISTDNAPKHDLEENNSEEIQDIQKQIQHYQEKLKAKKQKIHNTRDWKAYNDAQQNYETEFEHLIQELIATHIPQQEHTGRGRPPIQTQTKLYALFQKAFYQLTLRETHGRLKTKKHLPIVQRVPSFKSISNFYRDTTIQQIIDDLLFISAYPLLKLEKTVAIDGSGFTNNTFTEWNNIRHGDGRQKDWRKGHILTGTNTHCIITATTTDNHRHDNTQVEKLVRKEQINKTDLENFVADKAYNARNTFNHVYEAGLTPFIPFKENTTNKMKGSLIWHKMWNAFHNRRKQFMSIYHQRSNVETVFYMVKQHFSDQLMTESVEANDVELKIMFICHNMLRLIHKVREENIDIDFTQPRCVKNKTVV